MFDNDKAVRICALIESGMTLRKAAETEAISASLIIKYANQDPEGFGKRYAQAIDLRTDQDFDGLVDLAFEEPERGKFGVDNAAVQLRKLQIDTVKWALSKRNPKKYGDRLQVEGNIELGLAERLSKAVKRVDPE